MKIILELDEQERMACLEKLTRTTASVADQALSNYFESISVEDFSNLLRRALRTSCDAFFQHYMQYYIERQGPEILKKIRRDIAERTTGENDEKSGVR